MNFEARYRDGDYLAETGDWHEEDAAWKAARVAEAMEAAGLSPSTVADFGCGSGGVLASLQPMLPPEVRLTGFEMAPPAFALAGARSNDRLRFVNASPAEDVEARFDVALVLDVFEHVPDYLGFLDSIRGKADAFIFHIPLDLSIRSILRDGPSEKRRRIGHLHYFTAPTARATLEDCGYRIRHCRFTHAALQPPPIGLKARLGFIPDRLLFRLHPNLCATLFGGCALLVVAEPAR